MEDKGKFMDSASSELDEIDSRKFLERERGGGPVNNRLCGEAPVKKAD